MVVRLEPDDEKRLARIQASAPPVRSAAGLPVLGPRGHRRSTPSLTLLERVARIEKVERERDGERNEQKTAMVIAIT